MTPEKLNAGLWRIVNGAASIILGPIIVVMIAIILNGLFA